MRVRAKGESPGETLRNTGYTLALTRRIQQCNKIDNIISSSFRIMSHGNSEHCHAQDSKLKPLQLFMAFANIELPVESCMYSRAHKYRSDQQYVRAPTLLWSATLCASGGPSEHSKSTSTPLCARLYWRNKRLWRMCGAGNSNRSVTLKQGWQHGPNLAAMRHAKDIHNDSLWHPGYSVKLASFDL